MKNELLDGKAKKQGVTAEDVDPKQLAMGKKIELEHTDKKKVAETIATDHLTEFPNYYTALNKMEDSLKKKAEMKLHVIGDKTAPTIIAEYAPKEKGATATISPVVTVAMGMMAKNKLQYIENAVLREAEKSIIKIVKDKPIDKTSSYLKDVTVFAFNNELQKLAVSYGYLMSKVPLLAKATMKATGELPGVKKAMESGRKLSAMNMLNRGVERVGVKARPRMSIKSPEVFPSAPQTAHIGTYRQPGGGVPKTKFVTKEYPQYSATTAINE